MSVAQKRKATSYQYADDKIEFRALGSGQEVGRSCHILKLHGKTIMLDCGVHPAYSGINSLPFFDYIEISTIDLLLISHFHLDHVAALPYIMKKEGFRAAVYMTHPTKSITQLMLEDFIKVTAFGKNDDSNLFTERDLRICMNKVQVINFHEVKNVLGIRFWCYYAGHVLGAAMFMIEVGSTRVLYTGDYSRSEDRHLPAAELPTDVDSIDLLIVEGTHGVQQHAPMPEREARFTRFVQDTVRMGGKCLIPQFALGSAQELLLILEEHWRKTPFLRQVPIYFTSALAKRCLSVYQRYATFMNHRIKELALKGRNPFDFQHVTCLSDIRSLDPMEPCVIIASPGMLQNGLSRSIFAEWCHDSRNSVIIAGYSVEGTLAYDLQMAPPKVFIRDDGTQVPVSLQIRVVPFTAHCDYNETRDFIQRLLPNNILIVHGNSGQVGDLQKALKDIPSLAKVNIESPQNGQEVEITLSKPKLVKTLGGVPLNTHTQRMLQQQEESQQEELRKQLSKSSNSTPTSILTPQQPYLKFSADENEPEDGTVVSGLLMKNETGFQLLSPAEFISFMPNEVNLLQQTISVSSTLPIPTIMNIIGGTFEISDVTEYSNDQSVTFKVMNTVTITATPEILPDGDGDKPSNPPVTTLPTSKTGDGNTKRPKASAVVTYRVHWLSDSVTDMISDAVIALITSAQLNPSAAKILGGKQARGCCAQSHDHDDGDDHEKIHKDHHSHSHSHSQRDDDESHDHEQMVSFLYGLQMAYGVTVLPSVSSFIAHLKQYLTWQYKTLINGDGDDVEGAVDGGDQKTIPVIKSEDNSLDLITSVNVSTNDVVNDPHLLSFFEPSSSPGSAPGNYLVYMEAARREDAKILFYIDNNLGFIHLHNLSVILLDSDAIEHLLSSVDSSQKSTSTEANTHNNSDSNSHGSEDSPTSMNDDTVTTTTTTAAIATAQPNDKLESNHDEIDIQTLLQVVAEMQNISGDDDALEQAFLTTFQQHIQHLYKSITPVSRHRFATEDTTQTNQPITMRTKGDDDLDEYDGDDDDDIGLPEGSFFSRSDLARVNAD